MLYASDIAFGEGHHIAEKARWVDTVEPEYLDEVGETTVGAKRLVGGDFYFTDTDHWYTYIQFEEHYRPVVSSSARTEVRPGEYTANELCLGPVHHITELLAEMDEAALIDAVTTWAPLIQHITDPSEAVQLAAVSFRGWLVPEPPIRVYGGRGWYMRKTGSLTFKNMIMYIENPTDAVKQRAKVNES